jgi:hypothetical protein
MIRAKRLTYAGGGPRIAGREMPSAEGRCQQLDTLGDYGVEYYNPLSDSWIPIANVKRTRDLAIATVERLKSVEVEARIFKLKEAPNEDAR